MSARVVLWFLVFIFIITVVAVYPFANGPAVGLPSALIQRESPSPERVATTQQTAQGINADPTHPVQKVGSALLTQEEAHRLSSWMKEHGYLFDVSNGGRTGYPSATGYEAMESAALRQLAAHGDQIAALTLGLRLVQREDASQRFTPSPSLDEGKRLLLQASVSGYTASLDALANLALEQASSGRELRRGERFVPEYMVEAYAYAYLLQRRGGLNAEMALQFVHLRGVLTLEQENQARQMAHAIYSDLSQRRMASGLPPFKNGIPQDIQQLSDRTVAIQWEQRSR